MANAVGVAGEVAQHFFWSPGRSFAVDHPFAVAQGRQIGGEGSRIRQRDVLAEKLQGSGPMSGGELLQDQPAEQT